MTDKVFLSTDKGVDRRYQYNILNITTSNPCEITLDTSGVFVPGDQIFISNTVGHMSQIRNTFLTVLSDNGTHITVDRDTSTGHTPYTSGGYVSAYVKRVTAIQNAINPKVDCPAHGFNNGDWVSFSRMEGMTQLDGKVYQVANVAQNHFDITGVDTTSFGAFTNGVLIPVHASQYFSVFDSLERVFYSFDYIHEKTDDAVLHELGDVSWQLNSNVISTSVDYSGVISAGDFIGKPTAAGNGNKETYWKVLSVSSNSISFIGYYGLASETVSGIKVVKHKNVVSYNNYTRSFTLFGGQTLEGGYDFVANSFNGESWLGNSLADTGSQNQGVYSSGSGNTVKNINIVNCYSNQFLGSANTAENCTFQAYQASILTSAGVTTLSNCTAMSPTYFNAPALSLGALTNFGSPCYIYCYHNPSSEGAVIGTQFPFNTIDFNNSEFLGGSNALQSAANMIVKNAKFYDAARGVVGNYPNTAYINCRFYRCVDGIHLGGSTSSGVYIKDCYFDTCDEAIYNQLNHTMVENCTFANNNYDYYNYFGGNCTLLNNTHITPAINAVFIRAYSGTVDVIGCTIDAASLAKAYAYSTSVNAISFTAPQLRLQESFGYTGQVYSNYQVLKNTDTTPISVQTKFSTTVQNNLLDFKVASTYTKQSIGKLLKIKMIAVSEGWAGELMPKIKLNDKTIFTGDAITSISSVDETQLEYTIPGGLITKDGELSINFQANCNNVSVNLYTFEVFDV